MVPTTRSRGAGLATLPLENTSAKDDGDNTCAMGAVKSRPTSPNNNSSSNKDKVYRKAAPKPKLQQKKFPARATAVRGKNTGGTAASSKRLSLPNPPSVSAREKGRKAVDPKEDRTQKTLTQMHWVPSTYPSGNEFMDDEADEGRPPLFDFTDSEDGAEVDGASFGLKKTRSVETRKKKAVVKKSSSRGRKRRETTGDLELELELEREDEDAEVEVSSSMYHTQTLTQMPSWRGLSGMVADSDEDLGIGFEDDLSQMDQDREDILRETPPSRKRKRASKSRPPADRDPTNDSVRSSTLAPNTSISSHVSPSVPTSTGPSVVPETPHQPRGMRTEIPSSQPSPFTPNLVLDLDQVASLNRFVSPLNHGADRRSPLKNRSTNVDAPVPTPSALRKRSRNEIPDSWSTVNGGMPSSGGGGVKRTPLKEIQSGDRSFDLGERSNIQLQCTAEDIILDSDDEFEGFPDEEVEASCTPTPHAQALTQRDEKPTAEGIESRRRSPPSVTEKIKVGEQSAEATSSAAKEPMVSTPAEQVTVPQEVTSNGLRSATPSGGDQDEIVEVEFEEAVTPTARIRRVATHQRASLSDTHRSPVHGSFAVLTATPILSVRNTSRQQPASHQAIQRTSTPEPPAEEDEDTEAATPSRPRRRPSSSSAVGKDTPLSSPQKTSPAMPAVSQYAYTQLGNTQLGYKSQAFESQRVPFDIIQQMTPRTDRSDVIISADPAEVRHIVEGRYTHLFRDFRIPMTVSRVWMYTTAPACQLKYMAAISDFKLPKEMGPQHELSIDLAEFAEGKRSKYAYELQQVYQLNNPVTLERMKEEGWGEQLSSAARIAYVPPGPLGALLGNLRCALFEEASDESGSSSQESTTVSQELAQQLRSDIEHSTQVLPEKFVGSTPGQPHKPRDQHESKGKELVIPSSQDVDEDRVRATPARTRFVSTKHVAFAKPKVPGSCSQRIAEEVEDSPPTTRQPSQQSQSIIKSTVRPSQASTMSDPSQSQSERRIEYCTIPDSPSPVRVRVRVRAAGPVSSMPMMVDDSPIRTRMNGSSGKTAPETSHPTQSSLGLAALLGSSQGIGLAGSGHEQDSLMDESKIKMPPPAVEEVDDWDSDDEL
ncbi:unnamed protein product [Discula destructiva]